MEQTTTAPSTYTVDALIGLLRKHQLPPGVTARGNPVPWGIGWKTHKAGPDTYDFHPRLKSAILDSVRDLVGPRADDDYPSAQCILDYKDMYWVVNFEFYDSEGDVDNDYSMMVQIHELEVKDLLESLVKQKVEVYTLTGPIVLCSSAMEE